ncbi:protein NLP4-like [Bidens hawaiensis]|uniref:protein NLP4-like n=1 Tax=Bidens hawaiensis TaxID=980011 RepID=UPI00404AD420
MNDHLASVFGSIKESDLTSLDDRSYDLQSSSPYLNSSESYLTCLYQNLSHGRCYEDGDVKPFEYRLTDTFFDDQTPANFNSKLVANSIYQDLYNGSYESALTEIRQVLKSVCDTHCLPLSQTWSPCGQQSRSRCQQQSAGCISVITSASYVFDPNVLGFYEACTELHVARGEGIVGKAIGTNQPCFATDITGFSTSEYPLTGHAKVLGLGGAVAIRLRSTYTGPTDFVLEFFLPRDCRTDDEQKQMLSSISCVMQRVSRSLYVMNDDELEKDEDSVSVKETGESSWILDMMEAQRRGESVIVSTGTHKEEPQEFKVINQWDYYQSTLTRDKKQVKPDMRPKGRRRPLATRRSEEKRRVKAERNISLPLLQQYFPGSLKDAAKSIGVCPTTLKRICREHGIMRWPSRKIKKVGHSLKKLQLIIDSVQGAEGTIQLGSFYSNFPELNSQNSRNPTPTIDHVKKSTSCSSSCGSHDSGSSTLCCSNQTTLNTQPVQVHRSSLFKTKREKHADEGVFRGKAGYGEQKIRLHMPQEWRFGDLQRELMRRFNIDDMNIITIKYLDDDSEWVLLTCEADLDECMDINMATKTCAIKIFVSQSFHQESGSSFIGNC